MGGTMPEKNLVFFRIKKIPVPIDAVPGKLK